MVSSVDPKPMANMTPLTQRVNKPTDPGVEAFLYDVFRLKQKIVVICGPGISEAAGSK